MKPLATHRTPARVLPTLLWPTLLWKEWRDHRTSLLAAAIGLPALIALGIATMPASVAREPALPGLTALECVAIVALTLIADVIPGEEQRGTIALLRRIPSGLASVFVAKLAFVLIAALTLPVIGYVGTTTASALLRGGPWFPPFPTSYFAWVGPLLVVAAWIFVVSTWLPRGTWALPAALFVLALFVLPLWIVTETHRGLALRFAEYRIGQVGLIIAAPLIAAFSFVLGRRHRGVLASAGFGLIATFLAFVPAYGWSAWRVAEWHRLDPTLPNFRIEASFSTFLGSDGRHAFVTGYHELGAFASEMSWHRGSANTGEGPKHALVVDLADGSWRELGTSGDHFNAFILWMQAKPVPYVSLATSVMRKGVAASRLVRFDATTLAPIGTAYSDDSPRPFAGTAEESAFQRAVNAMRLPDGRRVWAGANELLTDDGAGGVRVLPDSHWTNGLPISDGHGYLMWEGRQQSVYDVSRERRFAFPENTPLWWVRPGLWLERVPKRSTPFSTSARGFGLFDPVTQERRPLPSSLDEAQFLGTVDDGRILTLFGTKSWPMSSLTLVDPESGVREPIAVPEWLARQPGWIRIEGRTPSGAPVLVINGPYENLANRWWYGRLDLAQRRLVVAGDRDHPGDCLIACPDEETLILVSRDRRQLLRGHFGRADTEVVFP